MTPAGEIVYDKPPPQDETQLRQVFNDMKEYGTVLMAVGQCNTIGVLAIAGTILIHRRCSTDDPDML